MTRLHELLDGLAQEAKLYDVTERALSLSRRRRHRRRIAAATGATAAISVLIGLSLAPPQSQPPPGERPSPSEQAGPPRLPTACVQHRLPLPDGHANAYVTGADPTGRYVLGNTYDGSKVLIWVDGKLQATLSLGRQAVLTDINSGGTAVGNYLVGDGRTTAQAFAYRDGRQIPLKGRLPTANAINERGMIVGEVDGRPVRWADVDAEPQPLPMLPEANYGPGGDIDEDGTAIGTLNPNMPHVWSPDDAVRPMPGATHISSIRSGWVAGISTDHKPTRWNLHTGAMERLSGDVGGILQVNALGWAAGGTTDGRLRLADTEGFVELPGGGRAVRLSDDGMTIAGITGVDAKPVPVRWRCAR